MASAPNSGLTARQIVTIGGVTLLSAALGYCVYFDHKRRHDPVFRRKLQREHRKLNKAARTTAARESQDVEAIIKATVAAVNSEPLPQTVEAKESFFMEQVGMGEMLAQRLPQGAMPAAIAFFKAYRVYPAPQELLMIYQRTVPQEVWMLVMEMVKLDIQNTIGGGAAGAAGLGAGPSRPSGDAILEEIPPEERAKSTATNPAPSSGSSSSPTTSSSSSGAGLSSAAPSESGSGNGNSFVLVDDAAQTSPRAPAATTEGAAEAELTKAESLTESLVAETETEASEEAALVGGEATGETTPQQEPLS